MPRHRTYQAETHSRRALIDAMAESPALPDDPALLKQIVNNLLVRLNEMRAGLGDNLLKYAIKPIATLEKAQKARPDWLTLQDEIEACLADIAFVGMKPGNHDPVAMAIHRERIETFLRTIHFPTDPADRVDRLPFIVTHEQALLHALAPVICRCRPSTSFSDMKAPNSPHPTIQGWALHILAHHHNIAVGTAISLLKLANRDAAQNPTL